jgi:hypothetical protein
MSVAVIRPCYQLHLINVFQPITGFSEVVQTIFLTSN